MENLTTLIDRYCIKIPSNISHFNPSHSISNNSIKVLKKRPEILDNLGSLKSSIKDEIVKKAPYINYILLENKFTDKDFDTIFGGMESIDFLVLGDIKNTYKTLDFLSNLFSFFYMDYTVLPNIKTISIKNDDPEIDHEKAIDLIKEKFVLYGN